MPSTEDVRPSQQADIIYPVHFIVQGRDIWMACMAEVSQTMPSCVLRVARFGGAAATS